MYVVEKKQYVFSGPDGTPWAEIHVMCEPKNDLESEWFNLIDLKNLG